MFGPREFRAYSKLAEKVNEDGKVDSLTPLETKYQSAIREVSEGRILFSYVDQDKFSARTSFYQRKLTSSENERPSHLAVRMQNEVVVTAFLVTASCLTVSIIGRDTWAWQADVQRV